MTMNLIEEKLKIRSIQNQTKFMMLVLEYGEKSGDYDLLCRKIPEFTERLLKFSEGKVEKKCYVN